MMRSPRGRHAGLALGLVALGATCSSPTDQGEAVPSISLTVVSGGGQTAPAGSELPSPLVVKVLDQDGKPFKGYIVTFRVSLGGGRMYAGTGQTDSRGITQDWWTLGAAEGTQQVDVVAVDPGSSAKLNFGSFTATATAPPPP